MIDYIASVGDSFPTLRLPIHPHQPSTYTLHQKDSDSVAHPNTSLSMTEAGLKQK